MTEPNNLISPEVLVPRLGDQLVEMRLLTTKQLQQALDFQKTCTENGRNLLLGQATLELGFLDRSTLDWAVTEQIMYLRVALEDANRNLELRVQQRTTELEVALSRLSETNQLKANFVANVSHELRTPLTHIRGYLDLLHSQALGDLNLDQKNALSVSLQSCLRLQALIDDLILFSQVSRGQMTLTKRPIDLKLIAENIFKRYKPQADDHHLSFEVDIEEDVPSVEADEEKIIWVITQLLDNAIKFSNPEGKVSLKICNDFPANNLVTISVSDQGIGIPKEQIKEIFEPFHQLDGSITRRYGGTGLGLTLVLQIIEAHGSIVDVVSEFGKGTTISFPLLAIKAA